MRDLPGGAALLALGRETLVNQLLPRLPPECHRELRLIATAIAIAEREAIAGDAPANDILRLLQRFYSADKNALCAPKVGDGDLVQLLHRLADDLREGAFDGCNRRERAARAILWRLTILKLREGNPQFLAENGFGE